MTRQNNYYLSSELIEQGLKAVPELLHVLINNVRQVERSRHIQAVDYERTEERKGHAIGCKPKTVKTLIVEITFGANAVSRRRFLLLGFVKGITE